MRVPRKRLEEEFRRTLADAWNTWAEYGGLEVGSPFGDLDDLPELDDNAGFNHTIGWLRGVAEATGWELDRPSPKDWSPRRPR